MKTFMETSTQTQRQVIAQIEAKFASSDNRQKCMEEAIESEGAASWRRDRELAQEIVGSKGQLDNHERLINVLGTELVNQREAREESDRQLAEMKTMLESLLNQVKGQGNQSDPTPEGSITAGGGNGGNRPPPPQQAAPGATGGGDSDDDADDEEGPNKGRRDERPASKGKGPEENEDEEEATWDEFSFSQALGKAIGDTTKRPAQPPPEYEHAKHEAVRF